MNDDPAVRPERRGSIVIAEDEQGVARSIERTLTEAGYEVADIVLSLEETLETVSRTSPDLLLLGLGSGPLDARIRLVHRVDVPVVLVSGRSDVHTVRRAGATPALGFLVKPFEAAQLLASVELALVRTSRPQDRALEKARRALADIAQTLERAGYPRGPSSSGPLRVRAVPGIERLTNREREVLDGLLSYQRPPQIAQRLSISPHTVRNHLKSIYQKLGVHSQAELLDHLVERE